jgi:magnesium-protoporphyrin O-methyltransferase
MNPSYLARRQKLTQYFDQTAADAWAQLTSLEPVGRIRATVRAGRDEMRALLMAWLPADLSGAHLLDAGCGTGALALEAASRGARVTAIDVSATLVDVAERRTDAALRHLIDYRVGDMLNPGDCTFDHVVAMDSLIHYRAEDMAQAVAALARLARRSVVFTFAPRTPALTLMHVVGRMAPHREHRAPAIEPIGANALKQRLGSVPALAEWQTGRTQLVSSGFYKSQALELVKR